jgi:hypothetical protein
MKKIFIAVMLITLVSCEQEIENSKQTSISFGHISPLQIVEVDNCQYLLGDWGRESVFTHKGDCNNPIHKINF